MTVTKTTIEKFDRNINFGTWQLKMEAILIQAGLDLMLFGKEKIPASMNDGDLQI